MNSKNFMASMSSQFTLEEDNYRTILFRQTGRTMVLSTRTIRTTSQLIKDFNLKTHCTLLTKSITNMDTLRTLTSSSSTPSKCTWIFNLNNNSSLTTNRSYLVAIPPPLWSAVLMNCFPCMHSFNSFSNFHDSGLKAL